MRPHYSTRLERNSSGQLQIVTLLRIPYVSSDPCPSVPLIPDFRRVRIHAALDPQKETLAMKFVDEFMAYAPQAV